MSHLEMPAVELDPPGVPPKMIEEVRRYWSGKCRDGALPRRDQILPSELKAWLPYVLLADVVDGGSDFRYRLVGTRITPDFATPPTGRLMSEVLAPFGEAAIEVTIRTYNVVCRSRAPLRVKGSGAWYAHGAKTFDAVLMPLSDDGVAVNMIFGAFAFVWDTERVIPAHSLRALTQ